VAVDDRVPVPEQGLVPVLLVGLPLLVGDRLLDDLLLVQVPSDRFEITLFKVFDDVLLPQNGSEVCEEVLDEDFGCLRVPCEN